MADENPNQLSKNSNFSRNQTRIGNKKYRQIKKKPLQSRKSENDVYVTSKSDFKSQVNKVKELFEEGASEVIVHGLGYAITKAANVALLIQKELSYTVNLSVYTDTVHLEDEWEPLSDSEEPFTSSRSSSAIHIKIIRVAEFK